MAALTEAACNAVSIRKAAISTVNADFDIVLILKFMFSCCFLKDGAAAVV